MQTKEQKKSKLMDYPSERKVVFDSTSVYFECYRVDDYNLMFASRVLHVFACRWETMTPGDVITIAEVLKALGIKTDTKDYLFGWIKGRSSKPDYSIDNGNERVSIKLSWYDYIPECIEDANEEQVEEKA